MELNVLTLSEVSKDSWVLRCHMLKDKDVVFQI